MKLQLVSFDLCPFVQRAVIMLREKGRAPEVRYIDLSNKPQWFLDISPRGKVPVLLADETPIFESQAIVEFLEEVVPEPPLRAEDPVGRARDRAWFAVASEDLLMNQYRMDYGADEAAVRTAHEALVRSLDRFEPELEGRSFLSGEGARFGMADVAMAPFLYRAELARRRGWHDLFEGRPNLTAWAKRVLERPSVHSSVPEDFEARAAQRLEAAGAWVVSNPGAL